MEGAAHTCSGSGTFLAAEAHGSEELEPIMELARFNVQVQSVIRGVDEAQVRERLTPLMTELLNDDLVDWVDFTVEARP